MSARGPLVHGAILVVAAALAYRSYSREETSAPKTGAAELWGGRPDQIQEVRFEYKNGSLRLEPRQDTHGRYFVGTVVKTPEPPKAPAPAGSAEPPAPPPPAAPKTSHFISTKDGEDLVATLAPLQAMRVLGKVEDAQRGDFGLDIDEGKLFVRIGGQERGIAFGGATPGGTDRYATDPTSGNAYVVSGAIFRDLTSADQRLIEHRLHGFEDTAPRRVKVTVGEASRELVRTPDRKDSWSRPETPAEKDETVTNWLSKLDRLRTTTYLAEKPEPPIAPTDVVVRVDYSDERKPIGFVEIVRRPPLTGDKPEYAIRTELTRWYADIVRSAGEQLDQDAKSLVGP
ncbi:MAG: DUF4340 domain-containing protein [Deltaproteobacteria bacterium]|nr:DUF4340 domain-containing protein [Deltaproteobacteria bacterium]